MDANAIAAALQDLLGPDVFYYSGGGLRDCPLWSWGEWGIYADGVLHDYRDSECDSLLTDADTLDKLHAASQIVRRFAGAEHV